MKSVKQKHAVGIFKAEDPKHMPPSLLGRLRDYGIHATIIEPTPNKFLFVAYCDNFVVMQSFMRGAEKHCVYAAISPNRRQLCRWVNEHYPNLTRVERGRIYRVTVAS